MTDQMLEESPDTMLAKVSNTEMALWSETKRQEFVDLFKQRSMVAQYLLVQSANLIIHRARERHFIGGSTSEKLFEKLHREELTSDYGRNVAGRNTTELNRIAEERVALLLEELPSTQKAVSIIDPETAALIRKKEALLDKLKELKEKLEELPNEIDMRELAPNTTVGAFLKQVDDLEDLREKTIKQMAKIGKEGNSVLSIINKRLYKGLPGLSEAVVKVVNQYVERATALSGVTRRVEEKVKFGDSEAAVTLLKTFENDEVAVSDTIKLEFTAALEQLNLAGKKKLSGGRKKN